MLFFPLAYQSFHSTNLRRRQVLPGIGGIFSRQTEPEASLYVVPWNPETLHVERT